MTRLHTNELRKKVLFVLLVLVVGLWIIYECDEIGPFDRPKSAFREVDLLGLSCRIPDLEARDPRILSYLELGKEERHPECGQRKPLVISEPGGRLVRDPTSDIDCCYTPFYRTNDFKYRFLKDCIPFKESVVIQDEHVKVICKRGEKIVYQDFFMFIQDKYIESAKAQTLQDDVNVLILGLDGISRLNFHRQMPKTFDFLHRNTNMVEMFGYNKVGYNTFPNLIPLLCGISQNEIENGCWFNREGEFDNCTFIWQRYKEKGYMTAFGEDASNIGIFHYNKRGFREKPTDVYARVFHMVAEKESGFDYRLNANLCVGDRMSIQLVLDLIEKFSLRSLAKGKLNFGFFWQNSLTHDFLNLPRWGDELHLATLKKLKQAGVLERTVLVVMSDHGMRWGSFRNTHQGYLEERLPLLLVSFPRWMEQKWPRAIANLRTNSDRLITAYDLYETLYDLADLSRLDVEEREAASRMEKGVPRGLSLFLPIPSYRTCDLAAIDDHWCTCIQTEPIPTNDTTVMETANLVVRHMNGLLEGFRQCSKLRLKEIQDARAEPPHKEDLEDPGRDYWVRISVTPGTGVFESTFRHWSSTKISKLVGTVSRSTQYGNESRCISHFQLKLYCYCT